MSLTNVAFNASYGWAESASRTLEAQMAVPMFNEHPIEMGIKGNEATILARLTNDHAVAHALCGRLSRTACHARDRHQGHCRRSSAR